MSWLANLFKNTDKKVGKTFMGGMDYYANKDYNLAYKSFLTAFSMTKSKKIKLNCLLNASSAADNLNDKKEASSLLLEATKIKSSINDSVKDIADLLEKAFHLIGKDNLDEYGDLIGPLMIFKIAAQDYSFAKRLNKRINESNTTHKYNQFALEVYNNFVKEPEVIWGEENFIEFPSGFPSEFKIYVKAIQNAIRNSAALTSTLSNSTKKVKTNENIEISAIIKNYTPLTISNAFLNSGSKGTITKDVKDNFPKNLPSNEEISLSFQLKAQLTGMWNIGPLIVNYKIAGNNYEYKSEIIQIEVLEGEKSVDLLVDHSEIEEDFEYEILGEIINNGNTVIENIKLSLKVPKEGKITEGTSEKTIFELRKGENFKFSNKIRFEAGILGKKYKIKVKALYLGGEFEKEVILSSEMI